MGTGPDYTPPWVEDFTPNEKTGGIHITVWFDAAAPHNLVNDPVQNPARCATVTNDADSIYTRIMIGLGPDGTPDTSPHIFTLAPGSTQRVTLAQLAGQGFTTIDQVRATQITAGR